MARVMLRGVLLLVLTAFALSMMAIAQEPEQQQKGVKINWQEGPTVGQLGSIAQLKIPAGYRFTGKEGALRVMELTHILRAEKNWAL